MVKATLAVAVAAIPLDGDAQVVQMVVQGGHLLLLVEVEVIVALTGFRTQDKS